MYFVSSFSIMELIKKSIFYAYILIFIIQLTLIKVSKSNQDADKDADEGEENESPENNEEEEEINSRDLNFVQQNNLTLERMIKDAHHLQNCLRILHGSKSLIIDPILTKMARDWAKYLGENNKFVHSPNSKNFGVGESIYIQQGAKMLEGRTAIRKWYIEGIAYDYSNTKVYSNTRHFVQMIFYSTKYVGYGVHENTTKSRTVIVANYDPSIYENESFIDFQHNVFPPFNKPLKCDPKLSAANNLYKYSKIVIFYCLYLINAII